MRADGSLGFTGPHSAIVPAGAYLSSFEYTPQTTSGSVGTVTVLNQGWNACPDGTVNTAGEKNYQIFARAVSPQSQSKECIDFGFGKRDFFVP